MNYPVWELTWLGGGTLIALIAVLHVYIAHLAVGGGMFIWLTDWKGYRENSAPIHDYVHRHTWFFLLLTMVFGGVTGVGIWFIISLVSPTATSTLIHNFVFGWAIEWVFFLGEITALLVYHYFFDRMSRRQRLTVSFLYFLFAWLSLFIINGILSFMLTPGRWLTSGEFWDGFFNPTFFPSLVFRTLLAAMIAGLFGYVTTVFLKDSEFRTRMLRYCGKWLLIPLIGALPAAYWYYAALPATVRTISFTLNPQTMPFVTVVAAATVALVLLGVFLTLRAGIVLQRLAVFVLLGVGLALMGGFEYVREISRKPYVINDFMYVNSVTRAQVPVLDRDGVLAHARWSDIHAVTAGNRPAAGRELFNLQCLGCHTMNGPRNDIVELTTHRPYLGLLAQLTGQGRILDYMPTVFGIPAEKEALAEWIAAGLHGREIRLEPKPYVITPLSTTVPPFNPDRNDYVLLAWNDLGMHCISDSDPWFVILPPANTLEAQLIQRGDPPQLITEEVTLRYKVEDGFDNPANHVRFWDYARENFGKELPKNIGLKGNGLRGELRFSKDRNGFIAEAIPVVPYNDNGSYNPYPTFTIQAIRTATGDILAETRVVTPVSTTMGCHNCHDGGWRVDGVAGIDDTTSTDILRVHDRINGTTLYRDARDGHPRLCQSCHADPALGAPGLPEHLNLSAAMHGWHANYMPVEGGAACALCHPSDPRGQTRCFRGVHNAAGLSCPDCHGTLQDHAISLLKGQADKPSAAPLLKHLTPRSAESTAAIKPRTPWINEPDCLTCHQGFQAPTATARAFNTWVAGFNDLYRIRTDNAMIRCAACHGSPHALYPARNPYDPNRDVLQPLQYQDSTAPVGSNLACPVCHRVKKEFPIHHENMARPFRNKALLE